MTKTIKFLAGATCVCMLLFTACQTEETSNNETQIDLDRIINTNTAQGRTLVTDPDILASIQTLDLDVGVVSIGDFHKPGGSVEERIYIGSDISFTHAELQQLVQAKQYRTTNLIEGNNQNIDILGYTGGSQALSNRAQTALQQAVENFNQLNTTLQFNLTFGTNFQAADMVVYDNSINNPGSSGGVAGFPTADGKPNKFVQIYGIDQFSTDVNEHVITHEIGHSVGFRHTDWFDRLSCPSSSQGNEGTGADGAIQIPGTPSGRDLTSVMQACFSLSVTGEFNGNDVTALEFMYPETPSGPCDGVSEYQRNVSYSPGDRVTYFGNLYERGTRRWFLIGPCN
jgi:hypothetical protein